LNIKKWHVGKLVILWIWGLVLSGLGLSMVTAVTSWVFGYLIIAVTLSMPVVLSVVTWRWLTGKELTKEARPGFRVDKIE
jgi:Ca2+-dependent lipid-binding protein